MSKLSLLWVLAVILLVECKTESKIYLEGSWKIDSVQNFYNGFQMVSHDFGDAPLYHFQTDGRLRMTKDNEFRYFFYQVAEDTLVVKTKTGTIVEKNYILSVDKQRLVLRKELSPLFTSQNQQRHTTTFFSRLTDGSAE